MALAPIDGIRYVWPTPIFGGMLPDHGTVNPGLRTHILDKEAASDSIGKSVTKGWHSAEDLTAESCAEMGHLFAFIKYALTQLTEVTTGLPAAEFETTDHITAWAVVLRNGGYSRLHSHPGHAWSGVYYVDQGQPYQGSEDAGCIEFIDPRTGVEMIPMPGNPYGGGISLRPEAGRLYCFPAWLKHQVHPFEGDGERIPVAFNVRIDKFHVSRNAADQGNG